MLHFFFSGLLSCLVGIRRGPVGVLLQERQLSLSSLCTYLPWNRNLVQAITSRLFEIIWYLVGEGVVGWGKSVLLSVTVQLILAYSLARPAVLAAGKGRGGMFLFLLFLHFHSFSSSFPVPLFHLLYYLFYLSSLSLGDNTKWPTRVDVSLNPNSVKKKSIFGRDIYQDMKACHMHKGQLFRMSYSYHFFVRRPSVRTSVPSVNTFKRQLLQNYCCDLSLIC